MVDFETQQKLDAMQREIDMLKQHGITRDLSVEQQDAINEIVGKTIKDLVWNDYLYFFYEDTLTAFTSGTVGNTGIVTKSPTFSDDIIRHDRETRFRCSVTSSVSPINDALTYITTIDDVYVFGEKASAVGFKLQSGVVYGVAHADGNETATVIGEYEASVPQILELRYFPRDRVDFYIANEYKASISTNLPVSTGQTDAVIDYIAVTAETITLNKPATIDVDYFEFMQTRN